MVEATFSSATPRPAPVASVIIPAHNEAASIADNLRALLSRGDLFEVVVVCNGCTDNTAELVRAEFDDVRVIELTEPGKCGAVAVGNQVATVFPRIHLDADIRLSASSAQALVKALNDGPIAVAPRRVLDATESPLPVRWYHEVWQALPHVQQGLFGRGVFALTEEGQRRVDALPAAMNDDLVTSEAFAADERAIVDEAESVVRLPRRTRDLIRRRVRVVTGNAQATRNNLRTPESATGVRTLVSLARSRPSLVPKVAVFLAITVIARARAQRAIRAGDFQTWLRDDSSRAASHSASGEA